MATHSTEQKLTAALNSGKPLGLARARQIREMIANGDITEAPPTSQRRLSPADVDHFAATSDRAHDTATEGYARRPFRVNFKE